MKQRVVIREDSISVIYNQVKGVFFLFSASETLPNYIQACCVKGWSLHNVLSNAGMVSFISKIAHYARTHHEPVLITARCYSVSTDVFNKEEISMTHKLMRLLSKLFPPNMRVQCIFNLTVETPVDSREHLVFKLVRNLK